MYIECCGGGVECCNTPSGDGGVYVDAVSNQHGDRFDLVRAIWGTTYCSVHGSVSARIDLIDVCDYPLFEEVLGAFQEAASDQVLEQSVVRQAVFESAVAGLNFRL